MIVDIAGIFSKKNFEFFFLKKIIFFSTFLQGSFTYLCRSNQTQITLNNIVYYCNTIAIVNDSTVVLLFTIVLEV